MQEKETKEFYKQKQVHGGMALSKQGMKWIVLYSLLLFWRNLGMRQTQGQNLTIQGHYTYIY